MSSECDDQMLDMMSCSLNFHFPTTAAHTNTTSARNAAVFNLDPVLLTNQHIDLIILTANQLRNLENTTRLQSSSQCGAHSHSRGCRTTMKTCTHGECQYTVDTRGYMNMPMRKIIDADIQLHTDPSFWVTLTSSVKRFLWMGLMKMCKFKLILCLRAPCMQVFGWLAVGSVTISLLQKHREPL